MEPVVNPNFFYLLPIGAGKEAQAFRVNAIHSTGQDSSYTIRLKMNIDDTIYAARRGLDAYLGRELSEAIKARAAAQ